MRSLTRLIGAILAGLAVLGAIASFVFRSDDDLLSEHGRDAKGIVIAKWIGDPKLTTTFRNSRYLIAYEFQTHSGDSVRSEFAITTRSAYDTVKVKGPLLVRYLPDDPKVHEPSEYRDPPSALRMLWGRLLVCGVLLLIGVAMIWLTFREEAAAAAELAGPPPEPTKPQFNRSVRRSNDYGVRMK